MDDTGIEVRRLVRERFASLSGQQRLVMGAEMFEAARTIALASFPADLSAREIRRRLCERFYGKLSERVFGEQ